MMNVEIEIFNYKGEEDRYDENLDVFVTYQNKKYVGSFFTYKNIESLIAKNKEWGELLNGRYFWASDMILVEEITPELIRKVIVEMINDESFFKAFSYIPDDELLDD
ncbi:hypothetical protein [Moheibacter sediminis]|uniref:Immunity protein 8 n=1 Tax=Moheibacter sediminis TaxID=1434700 RepID=A0A1W2CG95_9FLAO|nr:hypothetical protein [Moheibacter sediminis]SMC84243.1 hypothetical protein SAMN06296427_11051 [Moheibacter sediminis]